MKKALIITLSNVGDMVMTTAVMEKLNKDFEFNSIDVLGDNRSLELLESAPYINHLFHKAKRDSLFNKIKLISKLRKTKYDLIIDLRTWFLPFLLRAKEKIIKNKKNKRIHSVVENYSVLKPLLKVEHDELFCCIHTGPIKNAYLNNIISGIFASDVLAVAPGANWPGKKWPAELYGKLILELLKINRFRYVVILGDKYDLTDNLKIPRTDKVKDLRGQTNLKEASAILSKADAFIGNDSGLGHIAAAVGTKTLTLFGPGNPIRYRPWGQQNRIVIAPNKNLSELTVSQVISELKKL